MFFFANYQGIRRSFPAAPTSISVLPEDFRRGDFSRYNQRKLYPLVDDKLKTKLLAEQRGLAVPKLYGVVREQLDMIDWSMYPQSGPRRRR